MMQARQQGFATLSIGVVILLVISLMTIYASRNAILDVRTAADHVRYREALAQAELKVERGFAWIMANRAGLNTSGWTGANTFGTCVASNVSLPCGDGNTNRYGSGHRYRCHGANGAVVDCANADFFVMGPVVAANTVQTQFDVIAEGKSIDLLGRAVVKQGIYFYELGTTSDVPAPFIAAGNITNSGTFDLVANPNGGGPGVPVSAWTPNAVTNIGNAGTCQIAEFSVNNVCPNDDKLSSGTNIGSDIVSQATNFPGDLFEYLFGVVTADHLSIKNMASVQKISNCSALSSASKGIYWFSAAGNVTCAPSGQIGSPTGPVILVVEDQNFDYTSNQTFHGILLSFSPATAGKEVKFAGTGSIRGVAITDNESAAGQVISGTFKLVYDASVLQSIKLDQTYMGMAKLPGSWADYLD